MIMVKEEIVVKKDMVMMVINMVRYISIYKIFYKIL